VPYNRDQGIGLNGSVNDATSGLLATGSASAPAMFLALRSAL